MNFQYSNKTVGAMMLAVVMLAGCKSKQDAAIDQAKKQAAATGQAQQVVSTDSNGNVTTTTVQPPAPGQTAQAITTTTTPAAPAAAAGPVAANTPAVAPGAPEQVASGTADQTAAQPAGPVDSSGQAVGPPAPGGAPIIRPADVNVPAGTNLTIRINQHISVKTSHAGDRFTGEVEEPVVGRGDRVVIPRGAPVSGVVVASHRRGHFKGSSILELRLTYLTLNGSRYALDTSDLTRTKKGKGKRSAAIIGGGAGAGMLVGGLATGGVGLLVGGLVGGGGGTLLSGLTGNRDIEIPAESIVRFKLADNLVIQPS
jgi:outer membrane murein-binding lipoprotein Lpp